MRTVAPVLVAAVAAAVSTFQRFLVALLIEFDVSVSAPASTRYTLASRFVAFLFVYGALLGVAYWAGDRADGDTRFSLVSAGVFAVGTATAMVITGAVLFTLGVENQDLFSMVAGLVGQSAGTGVELGVVTFAGLAAGSR
ncbi:hypothetical protein [Halobacterium jilantaiense]|uniref:Uncharacterized protein n=1 Tax=Halobacterium jilantaiense TaxID=355548 RepID=A0A1I0NHV7_9EURY|nr:hypothetical protein [Halobacterium jilantaiense]SEW00392.1 hypothetical protein SAMN04487945_0852 [Halobacterium jilantaiense]